MCIQNNMLMKTCKYTPSHKHTHTFVRTHAHMYIRTHVLMHTHTHKMVKKLML